MEKIKWPEKATNEQVIERIGEKRTRLNNILRRKAVRLCVCARVSVCVCVRVLDRLISLGVSVLTTQHEVAGLIPGTSTILNVD